ncbi:hypothetical protein MBLNU457_4421t1 [Dothideomycetes sp. NU457]
MSAAQSDGLGIEGLNGSLLNEQLATPALSPIAEHGATRDFNGLEDLRNNGNIASNSSASRPKDSSSVTTNGAGKENRRMSSSGGLASPTPSNAESAKVLKLSPHQIEALTSSPGSLPLRSVTPVPDDLSTLPEPPPRSQTTPQSGSALFTPSPKTLGAAIPTHIETSDSAPALASIRTTPGAVAVRPSSGPRSASTPSVKRKESTAALRNPSRKPSNEGLRSRRPSLAPIKVVDSVQRDGSTGRHSPVTEGEPSPMPSIIPLPPLSLPTYLQLELSAERPSALYIHRPVSTEFPYESSKVKFERLLNFLYLPPHLERALLFGALACLDAWLFTFTILPLRFMKAVALLVQWQIATLIREAIDIGRYVYSGTPRVWQRHRQGSVAASPRPSVSESEPQIRPSIELPVPAATDTTGSSPNPPPARRSRRTGFTSRHRRSKSIPSALLPNHKADILHGLLIIISCMIMVRLDASRMYHSIRGQAAIKLYVIYNVLEVGDRLFSALGQDILECLFSKETLERKPNGRSKIIRPIWMFIIALIYNVIHATMLFYQVVTLNVAVNSYSNALLTLLMSNQFVEIKGTVFKKFEKENLFQMTCADVVERFQLWLMLLIIAMRNIVEVGGLSITLSMSTSSQTTAPFPNTTSGSTSASSIVPHAFTLISNFSGQVLSPFFIVLGSEMLVDWVKHAYINKFNSVSPRIYSRFLDVLAKDYYSHAFADQNLTKRLGLPVLPLSCLFIRAAVQTYHMFVATHMPPPLPSARTSLSTESASSGSTAALAHIDGILRRALGRSSFGAGESTGLLSWSIDDFIALGTMVLFFLILYLVLLLCKLVLGMILLSFARGRYRGMKEREREGYDTHGKRVGGWGVVEVDDEKRRWIYDGDEEGLRKVKEREVRDRERKARDEVLKLDGVGRYMMAAKRIW